MYRVMHAVTCIVVGLCAILSDDYCAIIFVLIVTHLSLHNYSLSQRLNANVILFLAGITKVTKV